MDVLTAISAVRLANAKKIYKFKGVFSMKYVCTVCGWVYDPANNNNIAFEDLPDDWCCPTCGVSKDMFEKVG